MHSKYQNHKDRNAFLNKLLKKQKKIANHANQNKNKDMICFKTLHTGVFII